MKNYTILLAEDETGTREELYDILSFLSKKVYIASNGLEAKKIYDEYKPDLIITDIQMPKLSGLDLIKYIRKNDTTTSIAIVSAYIDTDYLLLATELHLLKYMVKPINKSKLFHLFELFKKEKELTKIILSDEYTFYPKKYSISTKLTQYQLTQKESDFLLLLFHKKDLVSYYEIEDILDIGDADSGNSIRQFIKNFRQKLPKNYIKNIQNLGYIIST